MVGCCSWRPLRPYFFLGMYKSVIVPSKASAAMPIVSESVGWGGSSDQYPRYRRPFRSQALLVFVPIMAASYDGIPPHKTDLASALLNAARNTGGSIGISLVSNAMSHREQFHQSRLVEHPIPSGVQYQDTLQQATKKLAPPRR